MKRTLCVNCFLCFSNIVARAMNFGGIGMVMGHELTHGFDNQGRKYDLHGNLQDWWEEAASANFTVRSGCMVDQYQQYTVESEGGTIHVS